MAPSSARHPRGGSGTLRWHARSARRLAGVSCQTAAAASVPAIAVQRDIDSRPATARAAMPKSIQVATYAAENSSIARPRRQTRLLAAVCLNAISAAGPIIATVIVNHCGNARATSAGRLPRPPACAPP
jgi:hypothetical protein